jgi:hypothetical protein
MPLTEEQHLRFARHLLLPEIGLEGQVRLCEGQAAWADAPRGLAREVAAVYLECSGVNVLETSALVSPQARPSHGAPGSCAVRQTVTLQVPSIPVDQPGLEAAAQALAGAWAAVEAIKALLGEGQPASSPPALSAGAEDEPVNTDGAA